MLQRQSNQTSLETLFLGIAVGLIAIFAVIYIGYLLFNMDFNSSTDVVSSSSVDTAPIVTYNDFTDTIAYIDTNGTLPISTFELADYYRSLGALLVNETINITQFQDYQTSLNAVEPFAGNRDVTYSEFVDVVNHIDVYHALPINTGHNLDAYYSYLNTLLLNETISMQQFNSYLNVLNLSEGMNGSLIDYEIHDSSLGVMPLTIDVVEPVMLTTVADNAQFVTMMDAIVAEGALPANSAFQVADYYHDLVTMLVNDSINSVQFDTYLNALNLIEPFRVTSSVTYTDFIDTVTYIEANGAMPADLAFEINAYYDYLDMLLLNETITVNQFNAYRDTLALVE